MEVVEAVQRERGESGGGGEDQMETERERGQRDGAKQGYHVRSYLQRAEWRLTRIDGPRH